MSCFAPLAQCQFGAGLTTFRIYDNFVGTYMI